MFSRMRSPRGGEVPSEDDMKQSSQHRAGEDTPRERLNFDCVVLVAGLGA